MASLLFVMAPYYGVLPLWAIACTLYRATLYVCGHVSTRQGILKTAIFPSFVCNNNPVYTNDKNSTNTSG